MGSAAATTNTTRPPLPPMSSSCGSGGAKMEALTHIDITQLSQSDLQALSLCSESAFNLHRTDDVVIPDIDRSLFNESAGSRRQAYSVLRHPHHRSHSRLPGLHPALKTHNHSNSSGDPVNHSIIHFLKHFLSGNHDPPPPPPPPPPLPPQAEAVPAPADGPGLGLLRLQEKLKIKLHGGENKRKKMRRNRNSNKNRLQENGVGMELQKVNVKGEEVDFENLEKNGDELYSEELKRRTMGLESEEGVLGFLSSLEGQWCSRRKKRKYVDAGVFGDALPIGWKLLLGLRRRDFRVSVYCRRIISPTGQQFISCKEAASFLRSYVEGNDADQPRDQKTCSILQAYGVATDVKPCATDKMDDLKHNKLALSTVVSSTPSDTHENDGCLVEIDNLPEVKVQDIFECFKCNLPFHEKKMFLDHLFSFHQKTTKRYRYGTPVGEGVIIRDGKYECQFCHKVFDERRSYNGHVGVHVRNSGKGSDELVTSTTVQENSQSPVQEVLPSRTSKMDALIEIAQNSIFENLKSGTSEHATRDQSPSGMNTQELQAINIDCEMSLCPDPSEIHTKELEPDNVPNEGLNSHDEQAKIEDGKLVDSTENANIVVGSNSSNDLVHVELNDIANYQNSELEAGFDDRGSNPSKVHLEDTPGLVEEISFHNMPSASSVPLPPSFQYFTSFDSISSKVEEGFSVIDQKLENVTGFEELRFEDIEPFKYGFDNGQESPSLPGGSIDLRHNAGMEDGFNSSIGFGSEEVALNTVDMNQVTTVCVWCRTEFRLEGVESESPSDSIGYMCPTCKDNISGHLNGSLSMDPGGF